MNDIKRLAGYIGSYKKDMMLGALMVMIETAFELVIPIMIADLIDVGVANHDLAYIYSKGFQMGICALLALVTGLDIIFGVTVTLKGGAACTTISLSRYPRKKGKS